MILILGGPPRAARSLTTHMQKSAILLATLLATHPLVMLVTSRMEGRFLTIAMQKLATSQATLLGTIQNLLVLV